MFEVFEVGIAEEHSPVIDPILHRISILIKDQKQTVITQTIKYCFGMSAAAVGDVDVDAIGFYL
jgi:hypothetical protein